jgi:transcriptional regulator with XRE-family HTH domain
MAEIKIYRSYEHYRDPVIDEVAAAIDKERLTKKLGIVAEISGLSRTTLSKWLTGETRRPQYATVMACMGALGYGHRGFQQQEKLNVEVARKEARKWLDRQEAKKANAKAKLIAQRKAAKAAGHPAGATSQRG